MDWWLIIKVVWGIVSIGFIALILIAVWRARGVISWNLTLQKELRALAREAENASPPRSKAILLIVEACKELTRSLSPEKAIRAERPRAFIRSIAACYFPEAEKPELQISLDHLIRSLDASLYRFDRILQRPGLKRIQRINLRTLHGFYRWSEGVARHPWAKWYMARHARIQQLLQLRLIIIPDPVSWVLFLSRKLLVLVLLKTLLVDLTLFVGRLALDAFDETASQPVEENRDDLETMLSELSDTETTSVMAVDPEVAAIRQELVGFSSILFSNPGWQDWKAAVREAAEVIARRHFPYAENPLEEAAIGPLLKRTRSWLGTLGKGNRIILVRSFYKMRLETLFQTKDISDLVFTQTVNGIMRKTLTAYGWVKWPLKIYRRLKRFTLPGVAADVGWVLGKKSALAMIHGRTFDQACRELEWVYRMSADMRSKSRIPSLSGGWRYRNPGTGLDE